ncbi:putative Cc-nbs-lrr resistance protein [Hibiscus syriacus]|uniref:Cc-nbs-lrr resistance protein n=1 Tax=Hibiscus syriacus TaxID=106335 RepID=A0A6A2ZIG4_HIBSY|nr:putative Cc-nbs-lrr resistance protein [Hibiscus syriacus]
MMMPQQQQPGQPVPPPAGWNPQQVPSPSQIQQYTAGSPATGSGEIRYLWIGDLQPWMNENYLINIFSQTGEVVSTKSYNGLPMPSAEQNFRMNWTALGYGEKRQEEGPEYTIFFGDLAADVSNYMLQETFKVVDCSERKEAWALSIQEERKEASTLSIQVNGIPQRIRLFLWLASKERIMTNVERYRRSIALQPHCPCCLEAVETTTHALRDCRNSIAVPIHWHPPPGSWICLNTDGAVSSGKATGSIGGLFKDNEGSWISGFNKKIGITNPLQCELWAILIGIQIAWDYGFEKLLIQTDSKEAVRFLHDHKAASSSNSLVRAIERFRHRSWAIDITWIDRECNPADKLAKLDSHYALQTFDVPPTHLLQSLDYDKHLLM